MLPQCCAKVRMSATGGQDMIIVYMVDEGKGKWFVTTRAADNILFCNESEWIVPGTIVD